MNSFTRGLAALATVGALSAAGSANAAFLLDDWQIDFGNAALGITGGSVVGGTSATSGIDFIGFNDSPLSVTYSDFDGSGGFSVGDRYTVRTKGVAGTLNDSVTGVIGQPLLNTNGFFAGFEGYELTYDAVLTIQVTGGTAASPIWTHVANPTDYLDFYIDDLGDLTKAVPGTGAGYTDGVKVLTFTSVAGDGGSANVAGTLDGSDDASFVLTNVWVAGVFKTLGGQELTPGLTIGLVDSNFDLDSNNDGALNETRGGFGCTAGNQSLTFFCGVEDGTFRLATAVPTPATLGLLGAGLLGLAAVGRRRQV